MYNIVPQMASWLPPTVMLSEANTGLLVPLVRELVINMFPCRPVESLNIRLHIWWTVLQMLQKQTNQRRCQNTMALPEWTGGESNNLGEGMDRLGNNVSRVRNPGCGGRVKRVNTKTYLYWILKLKGGHSIVGSLHFGKPHKCSLKCISSLCQCKHVSFYYNFPLFLLFFLFYLNVSFYVNAAL